ncbi:thermonuclease family protein [Orbaceae bacterium ESL0721]|nr:thermonuclease family protein [Orbaceae bacterium ESL0721]
MLKYISDSLFLSSLKKYLNIVLLLIFIISSQQAYADFRGKVVKVIDGDTVDILTSKKEKIRVRLTDIDAPERSQPYGGKAKNKLAQLIAGQHVFVKESKKDIYRRTLGTIFYNNVNINAKMVETGYAWAYRYKNVANNPRMLQLERKAKQEQRGLWRDKKPIAPWDYRHKKSDLRDQNKKQIFHRW